MLLQIHVLPKAQRAPVGNGIEYFDCMSVIENWLLLKSQNLLLFGILHGMLSLVETVLSLVIECLSYRT